MESLNLAAAFSAAIAPCVLISAFGLLLLSMTNRLGRSVDRLRALCKDSDAGLPDIVVKPQVDVLYRRCTIMRRAIGLCVLGLAGVGLLILALFAQSLLGLDLARLAEVLFIASLVLLVASLLYFFRDVRLSLHALRLELGRHWPGDEG